MGGVWAPTCGHRGPPLNWPLEALLDVLLPVNTLRRSCSAIIGPRGSTIFGAPVAFAQSSTSQPRLRGECHGPDSRSALLRVIGGLHTLLEAAKAEGAAVANFHEAEGKLVFNAEAPTQYVANVIWTSLKEAAGTEAPTDINANITVKDNSVYHRHTVVSGESLSKIAKHYFLDANKYPAIFEANKDILKNPDSINVGQVLVIPNL